MDLSIFFVGNKIIVFRTKQCIFEILNIHPRSLTRIKPAAPTRFFQFPHYWQVYNALFLLCLRVLGKFFAQNLKSSNCKISSSVKLMSRYLLSSSDIVKLAKGVYHVCVPLSR